MNDCVNRIGDVHRFLTKVNVAKPVILYPGDRWRVGEPVDSEQAIKAYQEDYQRVFDQQGLISSKFVTEDVLCQSGSEFLEKIRRRNNALFVRLLLRPVTFYVTDYHQALQLSIRDGLQAVQTLPSECDVAMTSEALNYCFRHLWGWNTLRINGRLQAPRGTQARFPRFTMFGNLSALNNAGIYVGLNAAFAAFVCRHLAQAVVEQLA